MPLHLFVQYVCVRLYILKHDADVAMRQVPAQLELAHAIVLAPRMPNRLDLPARAEFDQQVGRQIL